jgi:DNA-binding phage protein
MMVGMENSMTQAIKEKFASLKPMLDERARRLWAAVEARSIGRGGITRVSKATGLSRVTIRAGLKEVGHPHTATVGRADTGRIRRPGGGRKPLVDQDPKLLSDLESLVDPVTRGDPMSPLRWTCKSAAKLAEGLRSRGHAVWK